MWELNYCVILVHLFGENHRCHAPNTEAFSLLLLLLFQSAFDWRYRYPINPTFGTKRSQPRPLPYAKHHIDLDAGNSHSQQQGLFPVSLPLHPPLNSFQPLGFTPICSIDDIMRWLLSYPRRFLCAILAALFFFLICVSCFMSVQLRQGGGGAASIPRYPV